MGNRLLIGRCFVRRVVNGLVDAGRRCTEEVFFPAPKPDVSPEPAGSAGPSRFSGWFTAFLKIVLTLFIVLVAYMSIFPFPKGIFFSNYSRSITEGVYVRTWNQEFVKGSIVTVVIPYDLANLKKGTRLYKVVAGVPGDTYVVTEDELILDGLHYPIHREFRQLPQQAPGVYMVPDGYVLLLNEMPDSFDGRYFGVMRKRALEKRVRLLFSFKDLHDKVWMRLPAFMRERGASS